MSKREISADRAVDDLYVGLRRRHGDRSSRANGYLYEGYFRAEQLILFSLLGTDTHILVDVACGSGLMVQPLIDKKELVIGVDFNADACLAAQANGLAVVRGDAFSLPLQDESVDEIVTCQFFNQQRPEAVARFIAEAARILRPGGQLIMVWRNGSAWIHRLANAGIVLMNKLRGTKNFPYEDHALEAIRSYAHTASLEIKREAVSFPPANWFSEDIRSWRAKLVGASNILILGKPRL